MSGFPFRDEGGNVASMIADEQAQTSNSQAMSSEELQNLVGTIKYADDDVLLQELR